MVGLCCADCGSTRRGCCKIAKNNTTTRFVYYIVTMPIPIPNSVCGQSSSTKPRSQKQQKEHIAPHRRGLAHPANCGAAGVPLNCAWRIVRCGSCAIRAHIEIRRVLARRTDRRRTSRLFLRAKYGFGCCAKRKSC